MLKTWKKFLINLWQPCINNSPGPGQDIKRYPCGVQIDNQKVFCPRASTILRFLLLSNKQYKEVFFINENYHLLVEDYNKKKILPVQFYF